MLTTRGTLDDTPRHGSALHGQHGSTRHGGAATRHPTRLHTHCKQQAQLGGMRLGRHVYYVYLWGGRQVGSECAASSVWDAARPPPGPVIHGVQQAVVGGL